MPTIITMYFDADRRNDVDALLKTFAVDAVVQDENARHQGAAAIREWWLAVKKATEYVAEPLESNVNGNTICVRARVSGQFPGSPVMLTHVFTIQNDAIVMLEIQS